MSRPSYGGRRRAAPPAEPVSPVPPPKAAAPDDLVPIVGANLRRLRTKKGLSLERLAKVSGVSRAMLGQIELARSAPTINVLWRVARALGVPLSALLHEDTTEGTVVLRAASAKRLANGDGTFTSRALFPFDKPQRAELYELRLASGALEHADAHAPGTLENLVVSAGMVVITAGAERHALGTGDAIAFHADVPHSYENPGSVEATMFLVMTSALATS